MRRRRKILKPRTPNAPQAKNFETPRFFEIPREARRKFSVFLRAKMTFWTKIVTFYEAQNVGKIKPQFRNAPQAKNFETPFSKCAAGEKFWNHDFEMRRRRKILKPRKHRMRRRRKILKPREERMRRRRKILKPRIKELKIPDSYGGGLKLIAWYCLWSVDQQVKLLKLFR